MSLKVGDSVWLFDLNQRLYDGNRKLIYRAHFRACRVVDETRVSWVLDDRGRRRLVNKRTLQIKGGYGLSSRVFTSREQVDDEVFCHEHGSAIAERVRKADAGTLRAVAALLNEHEA